MLLHLHPIDWGLRDYGIEPIIWDGDKDCKHQWIKGKVAGDIRFRGENSIVGNERNLNIYPIKHRPNETNPGKEGWYKDKGGLSKNPSQSSFCSLCGAWRGSLGLEPTFELYIKHLCDIFDEVKRVLRKDGTCWVNMGDSYAGNMGKKSGWTDNKLGYGKEEAIDKGVCLTSKTKFEYTLPHKSLNLIPQRFVIEMVDRGWIARNVLIWWKPNCMPSSAKDRFTIDFEDVFFFTKSNKALFWTNEKTLECVGKQPLGTKGIESKDWEWRKCPNCQGEVQVIGRALKEGAAPRLMKGVGIVTKNTKAFKVCHHCKGSGKIKYSFWSGHDYWFEQQFEEHMTQENRPDGIVRNRIFNYDSKLNRLRGFKTKQIEEEIQGPQYHGKDINYGKQGRNKRAVWTIPTQPFPEAHFAVYPETLIEPMIKAGCPEFVCKKCGKARVKIYRTKVDPNKVPKKWRKTYRGKVELDGSPTKRSVSELYAESLAKERTVEGYSDCGCNAGWESGITLDPFMGAGTTALVALKQKKRFIGIEIKQGYIDMSYKRIARVQQEIF